MNTQTHHRSLLFNRRWPPLRKIRIHSVTAYGPFYRSESFELHKILRAVRKGQFSAPAKFTSGLTTPSQSLASQDANSSTLGSAMPTQKSWTLDDHGCFARLNVANPWWCGCKRLTRYYRNGIGHWSSVPLRWWTLVWRWYGGVGTGPDFGYKYGEKWTRSPNGKTLKTLALLSRCTTAA